MKKKTKFFTEKYFAAVKFLSGKGGDFTGTGVGVFHPGKSYSQTRITAKRQGVTIDEVLKEVREKSGYRFLYRVEEVNRYGKRDIDVKDAEVEDFLGQLLQNTDLTYEVENEVIIIRPEK